VKLKHLFILVGLLCPLSTFSQQLVNQLSSGGIAWGYKMTQFDGEIPIMDMGPIDEVTLAQEDLINDQNKGGSFRFGYNHFVNYNLNNSGYWKVLDNGDKVWRLGFSCPGAISINLAFQYVSIPAGAKLFVYNQDRTTCLGAFEQEHISPDLQFGTELLPGENIVVEYYVPAGLTNVGSLEIFRVTHGYRSIVDYVNRAFGGSGSCENNALCPAYSAYANQIKSVVCLVSGGSEFCTGALINNTCNDGTPYVLTANHCGSSGFGSWVFRFNWQAPTCTTPGSSPSSQSISGGTQRAANAGSDMSLVQINSAVPAGYNAYFAGWDRNNTGAVNQVAIHHPAGDIKKVSLATGVATTATYSGATCWKTGTWTDGVTEPGSSGSPLFNTSGLIVGQLFGGPSTCAYENDPVNGVDYYGKLFTSWTGGGTNATRLSNWLDPAGCNTGATVLVGYDPNAISLTYDAQVLSITAPSGTLCSGSTTPVIVIKNNGTTTLTSMTINYQVDGGATTPFSWTGSLTSGLSTNVTMPAITVAAGAHTYTVTIVTNSLNGSNTDLNTSNNASTSNFTAITATSSALPFAYGFEPTAMPPTTPAAWTLTNGLAGSITFARTTAAFSAGAASAWLNYFADNTGVGTTDDLVLPYLNFSSVGAPATMTFDVAHRRYSATYIDSLRVLVSTNCGASWTTVYSKGGSILGTVAGDQTTTFTPTAGQWRNESINLNAYAGLNNVLIKFQGYSGYGQNIYLDNINITGTVASPPTASFTTSGNTICAGQTVTYTSTSTGGPTSINWNFPGGSPATGTTSPITVTYATAGTYTTTLTATNGAGSTTATQTITVNARPTNTASNTGPYCSGATIQLNATAGATDYDWTGPNSFLQNNTQNPTITGSTAIMAGVYTVTLTNAAGCTATATTTVVVNTTPVANATNGGPYCVGTTIQLNSVGGSATDDWTGPSYTQNNTQNPTRTNCTLAMAGVYTVTVTSGTCSSTSTTTVVVNANPTASATNGGPYCSGATIQLNSVGGSATNDWTGPNSYVQNNVQNPTIPSSTTLMAGIYTVTVTNGAGCTATATTSVTVNPTPTPSATNTGPYCVGATIQLNSVGGSGTDDWTGPSYTQNNVQNPTIPSCTLGMAGVYTVTATSGTCSSTSTTTVVVNANPTANAANGGPYCSGATIQLNSVGGSATDDWAGPNSYTQTDAQNPTLASSTTAMAGVYTVTVTNVAGCTATATTSVSVTQTPAPVASNTGPYCPGATIQLNSAGGSATDDWAGPNGYVQNDQQNPTIPGATVAMDGVYTVTSTNGSCSSTSTTTVIVVNIASATATNTGAYCSGETISLDAIAGATDYAWTGPLGFTSGIQNPGIPAADVTMAGVYSVTVTFAGGCTSSATTTVVVNPNPAAPVITPSGPVVFCSGNSVTLTSSYATGNVWSTSATSAGIAVNSSGTYIVTFTDVNGCSSSASQAVTVNPLPTVTQSALGTACVTYPPITLTGGAPAGGAYSGTAVSGGQFDPALAGTGTFVITYTYTDGNGCTNTATSNLQVLPCTGLPGNTGTTISIYPNPAEQFVYITGLENKLYEFALINTLGQTIQNGQLFGDGLIDLAPVASGTYYLKIDGQYWKIIRK
jgi:hypothetical protein